MNINRDYLIINDVKKSNIKLDNGSMFFYITDKNTQNIFVNLVINISNNDLIQKYANIENAEDYTLTMNIVKPDNTYKIIEGKLHDKEKAIFEFDLKEDCVDKIGTYKCELLTKCNINNHEEITTSNKLTYKVKSSVLNDLDDIVEAPEYPLVIQLFDKLSDIDQYEEDRRANELARQLAEQQRQQRFNELDADMTDSIQAMDNKVEDIENRITTKEQAVDKLITDTKADLNEYKVAKDQEIDEYKTAKDTEINNAITAQDNKIDAAINAQNDRIAVVESSEAAQNNRLDTLENRTALHESRLTGVETKNTEQDGRLDIVENKNTQQDNRLDVVEAKNVEQDNRLNAIEAIDVAQNTRLDAIEIKNQEQDDRLLDIEKVNKRQDMNLKCLFAESKNNMIDITEEGNSIYLQNSTIGYTLIDEIKGNTLVNCNKEPDKELILNGNINTSGDNTVTLTEGVDGGLVDVALEGNTLVNVSKTKDSTAITKAYTVENSGNHIALQGDIDGNCRPVITGKTLWIDNDTEEVLTAFNETKNLRLQSTFEDNLVTQEMVDNGEEVADNLGKYRVDYKVTGKNLFDGEIRKGYYSNGVFKANANNSANVNPIRVKPNTSYVGSGDVCPRMTFYDKDMNFISSVTNQCNISPSNACYMNIHAHGATWFQIEEGNTATSYEPYKEYTKTLYLNSPLLEGDTIEEKDGGIYHVYRYGKVKLNNLFRGTGQVFDNGVLHFGNNTYLHALNTDNVICDKMVTTLLNSSVSFNSQAICTKMKPNQWRIYVPGLTTLNEYIDWIANSDINIVYEKATPQYEVISQNDTILCDSYVNGHLDVDSVVPIERVDFLHFEEELTYLYPSTQYAVQFVSNAVSKVDITLGGTELLNQNVVVGINKYTITTPSELINNNLILNGEGFNASNIVVTEATDQDFGYFEGMKSVGECEDLEIVSSNSDGTLSNTQTLTHEPLRGIGNIKDKYVLIDGKWYIERNCAEVVLDGVTNSGFTRLKKLESKNGYIKYPLTRADIKENSNIACETLKKVTDVLGETRPFSCIITKTGSYKLMLNLPTELVGTDDASVNSYLQNNNIRIVMELISPQYEPIDYNPFEVYSDITHISNNSTIPCNMTIKNTGYNCLLKPSTTYTVSSNLGLNVVTTPSTLTEDCLRFYDTDTSDITTMKNVMILEGDYTTNGKPIPSHFSGIESAFEQEYDAEKGKYKVKVRVQNEDASKENYIEFYIDKPLRGIGDIKDKVYVKNDKVVVERNCGQREYQDGDFGTYLTDKVNTVYPLAEPTYEEVEYNDTKLFIESFKNSTLFYNSNVPVTSTVHYSYSVPLVDTVAQTANVTDQQDSMIIDLAAQCAVMEMMLM